MKRSYMILTMLLVFSLIGLSLKFSFAYFSNIDNPPIKGRINTEKIALTIEGNKIESSLTKKYKDSYSTVYLKNITNDLTNYKLYIKEGNNNQIELNKLKVSIYDGNTGSSLVEDKIISNNVLFESSLNGNETRKLQLYIYLSDDILQSDIGKTVSLDLIVE